mgnify:CR=1 FL=1
MSVKSNLEAVAIRKVYNYIEKDPVNNLPKVGAFMDKYVRRGMRWTSSLPA